MRRAIFVGLCLLLGGRAAPAAAQGSAGGFAFGLAGLAVDADDRDLRSGADFAVVAGAGLRLGRVALGGEYGAYRMGNQQKAKATGGFLRFASGAPERVRPYLVLGVANYDLSPSVGNDSNGLGGSVGGGVEVGSGSRPLRLLVEGRYHSTFKRVAGAGSQRFVAIVAGLQAGF